jgi:hypothetical protein
MDQVVQNVVDFGKYRETKQSTPEDSEEEAALDAITIDFMQGMIFVLAKHGYDPQEPAIAEDMITISTLFQAAMDNINSKQNALYLLFPVINAVNQGIDPEELELPEHDNDN